MPEYMIWIWLSILVVSVLIEIFTMDMTSIWFSIGAVVAMILSAFKEVHWGIQVGVFFAISIICLLALRPFAKKFLMKKTEGKTNIEEFIGKKVKMITQCDFDNLGTTKINDVVWNVKSVDESVLLQNEIVEIVAIKGNKLIAKKIEAVESTEKLDV